jgi:hypothetical protein
MNESQEKKNKALHFQSLTQKHTNTEGRPVPLNSGKGGSSDKGCHITFSSVSHANQ